MSVIPTKRKRSSSVSSVSLSLAAPPKKFKGNVDWKSDTEISTTTMSTPEAVVRMTETLTPETILAIDMLGNNDAKLEHPVVDRSLFLDYIVSIHQNSTELMLANMLNEFKQKIRDIDAILNKCSLSTDGSFSHSYASKILLIVINTSNVRKRSLSLFLLDKLLGWGAKFTNQSDQVNGNEPALTTCVLSSNESALATCMLSRYCHRDNIDVANVIARHCSISTAVWTEQQMVLFTHAIIKNKRKWIRWIAEHAPSKVELNGLYDDKNPRGPITLFTTISSCVRVSVATLLTVLRLSNFHIRFPNECDAALAQHNSVLCQAAQNAPHIFATWVRSLSSDNGKRVGAILFDKKSPRVADCIYSSLIARLSMIAHDLNAESRRQLIQRELKDGKTIVPGTGGAPEITEPITISNDDDTDSIRSNQTVVSVYAEDGSIRADNVSRTNPYIESLANCDKKWLFKIPEIHFKDELGHGHGVFWNWAHLYIAWCCKQSDVMEAITPPHSTTTIYALVPTQTRYGIYKLLGRVMGWMFLHGFRAPFRLMSYVYDEMFFKATTQESEEKCYAETYPTEYKQILQPLLNGSTVAEVSRAVYLTEDAIIDERLGKPLAEVSKISFARWTMRQKTTHRALMQMIVLRDGFWDIVDHFTIANARVDDQIGLMYGAPTSIINAEDFIACCSYGGEPARQCSNPMILQFQEVIRSFTDVQVSTLYTFITAIGTRPQTGIDEKLKIIFISTTEKLPQARTCFAELWLPVFSTVEEMRHKLLISINYAHDSEFSFR